MTVVVPDAVPDIKAWLKNDPDSRAYHAGRVFFYIPDRVSGYPLCRLYRLDGGIQTQGGDAPLSQVDVTIECWGDTKAMWDQVRALALAIESSLWQIPSGSLINPSGQTRVRNAAAINSIESIDPDGAWPRMIVDTRWSLLPI